MISPFDKIIAFSVWLAQNFIVWKPHLFCYTIHVQTSYVLSFEKEQVKTIVH